MTDRIKDQSRFHLEVDIAVCKHIAFLTCFALHQLPYGWGERSPYSTMVISPSYPKRPKVYFAFFQCPYSLQVGP